MHRLTLIFITLVAASATSAVAAAAQPARPLTIAQAIAAALHNNADVLLAAAQQGEAAGQLLQARSALLPHLSAGISQSRQQVNLAAQGITFPGLPSTTTYNRFQARLQLRQTLFDLSAWQNLQSAQAARAAAAAREAAVREQVAERTALVYVSALRAQAALDAAKADLALARELTQLARHQHEVGFASGVDVARARTRVARQKARIAKTRTNLVQAKLRLARVTGLPQGKPLTLTGDMTMHSAALPAVRAAVRIALDKRPALVLARKRLQAKRNALDAVRAQRWPTVELFGAYGDAGNTPSENIEQTYRIGAHIDIPIFSGGAIAGRVQAATSRLTQARIRLRDTRDQIEQDVRLALRTLKSTRKQIQAARANRKLARRELQLARDRFAAGVTSNVEVINAQTSLANARARLVAARAQRATARVNFAAARGLATVIDLRASHHDK